MRHHTPLLRLTALAASLLMAPAAFAAAVSVAYGGTYDERTQAPAGDYDAIGGLLDVGEFTLLAGSNEFLGAARTPGDSSDFFSIRIAAGFELIGASISWATNANAFNPVFAAPAPIWTLEESTTTPTIFLQSLGFQGQDAPAVYTPTFAARGPGSYGMLLGNGTFAMNNNDAIAYRMVFDVRATTVIVNPVPEPGSLALAGLGLMALWVRRSPSWR